MTVTDDRAAVEFRQSIDMDTELERLLESATVLSYDPDQEIDWDKPLVTIESAKPLGRGETRWTSEGAHIVGSSVAFDTVGLPRGGERLNWYLHRAGDSGVMRGTVTGPDGNVSVSLNVIHGE